jgi:hypothetical protein
MGVSRILFGRTPQRSKGTATPAQSTPLGPRQTDSGPPPWQDLPEELGDDNDPAEAALGATIVGESQTQLAKTYLAKYPHLDFTYRRLGRHYVAAGQFAKGREVLEQGLAACPRRRLLCLDYAALEYEAGRSAAALVWWARAAERQLAVRHYDGPEAFTYLAYLAMLFGLPVQAQQLLEFADRHHVFRLSAPAKAELQALAKNLDRKEVVRRLSAVAQQLPPGG